MLAYLILTLLAAPPAEEAIEVSARAALTATDERISELDGRIAELKKELRPLKRSKVNPRLDKPYYPDHPRRTIFFPSTEERETAIEKVEEQMTSVTAARENLRSLKTIVFAPLGSAEGLDIGTVAPGPGMDSMEVVQVQPPDAALVQKVRYLGGATSRSPGHYSRSTYHIRGLPENLTLIDGRSAAKLRDHLFREAGTHTYATVDGGTNTVPQYEWVDPAPIVARVKELRAERENEVGAEGE